MIRPEVALAAGTRLPGDRHRTGVTRMAAGAVADGAVFVGLADAVALFASAGHGGWPFESGKRMRGAVDASGLVRLGKIHLLRGKSFLAAHSCPRYSGVTAAQELLVNIFMTAPAVARGQTADDGESVVRLALLPIRRLMAIEAIHTFLSVFAHFVFMHNRILRA